jgi:arabinose-5-phosphate isomerase
MKQSPTDLINRAREIVEREAEAVKALAGQFDQNLAGVVELLFNCQGHVLVTGMGTSHAVAQRMAHLLSCCGTPALCISAADSLHGASGAITPRDVVFIISKGGQSAELNQFAQVVKARGAKIVAQTEKPDSPLGQMADAVYHVVAMGDIDLYGMIATGSSLVSCAADNVLCALLLEMRGYTREEFGLTHPGGAVGRQLAGLEQERSS